MKAAFISEKNPSPKGGHHIFTFHFSLFTLKISTGEEAFPPAASCRKAILVR
jgi:hypothetical protein